MPLYDYRCTDCAHKFEAQRSIAARKFASCPSCEEGMGKQLVTAAHIDYLSMGLDPTGNPTAARKWAKMHEDMGTKPRGNVT